MGKRKSSEFITEGKINVEELRLEFESILIEAEKSNKGNKTAAVRFRGKVIALEKVIFKDLRHITPPKKK